MSSVANSVFRGALLFWIAACGSVANDGPPPDEFDGGGLGWVGSGGGGGFGGDAGRGNGQGSGNDGGSGRDGGRGGGGSMAGDADIVDAAGFEDGASPTDAASQGDADGGSSVGVTFNVPPGFFPSLDWVILGPSGYYTGTIYFGDAHSYEFVVGGIVSGKGYTLTLSGTDIDGDACSGTSAPFDVSPGVVSGAGVAITCHTGDAQSAVVSTGSVGVDAGVLLASP
jgi:hypothetical protein